MVNHNKKNKVVVLRWLVAAAGYFISPTLPQITAKDLGVYGEIFEIAEKDLLDEINAKLKAKSEDGTLAKIQQEHTEQARRSVQRPKEVAGITRATQARSWLHDPSLKIAKDIKNHKGQIIARAGTLINPLDTVPFRRPFVFIDSDDATQVSWLKSSFDLSQENLKVILVKGAPLELSEELKMPVFFDQGGAITRQLNIKAVPAVVRQEGKRLRIEEVHLKNSQQDGQQLAPQLKIPQQTKEKS